MREELKMKDGIIHAQADEIDKIRRELAEKVQQEEARTNIEKALTEFIVNVKVFDYIQFPNSVKETL